MTSSPTNTEKKKKNGRKKRKNECEQISTENEKIAGKKHSSSPSMIIL